MVEWAEAISLPLFLNAEYTFEVFEKHSFGQKSQPPPFSTARVLTVLHRLDDLPAEAGSVDIAGLASSKGGTGHPVAPGAAVGGAAR